MLNIIYHIAKADFLHRVRSYSFLITLFACLWASYGAIPTKDSNYYTVGIGNYLFTYNSPAIGSIMMVFCGVFLGLFGFYLVNNSIHRDFQTGVGQILATTQVTKFQYLLGKWLSNFSVLATILLAMYVISIVLFYHKGEAESIEPIKQLLPFIFLGLPAFAFISALAVFGEVFIKINKGIINILYYVFWTVLLILNITAWQAKKKESIVAEFINTDYIGISLVFADAEKAVLTQFPTTKTEKIQWSSGIRIYGKGQKEAMKKFVWTGMSWDFITIFKRLIWIFISVGIVGLASLFFRRFDPSGITTNFLSRKNTKKQENLAIEDVIESKPLIPFAELPKATISFNFLALVKAELKIMLWGLSKWWLLVTVGLWIATVFTPLEMAHQFLLPILYVWFLLIWSAMGTREMEHETNQYLFSAASPLSRQLPAQLVAGFCLALAISLPILIRQAVVMNFAAVYGVVTAILFVPSFALCIGLWTQGGKFFQVLFAIWYYTLVNNLSFADFVAGMPITQQEGYYTHIYLLIALISIALSFVGRRKQLYI